MAVRSAVEDLHDQTASGMRAVSGSSNVSNYVVVRPSRVFLFSLRLSERRTCRGQPHSKSDGGARTEGFVPPHTSGVRSHKGRRWPWRWRRRTEERRTRRKNNIFQTGIIPKAALQIPLYSRGGPGTVLKRSERNREVNLPMQLLCPRRLRRVSRPRAWAQLCQTHHLIKTRPNGIECSSVPL